LKATLEKAEFKDEESFKLQVAEAVEAIATPLNESDDDDKEDDKETPLSESEKVMKQVGLLR
jgi:hypothetical protein